MVFTSAAAPLKVVTVEALIVPLVLVSRALRSVAASVESLIVTASLPRPVRPELL